MTEITRSKHASTIVGIEHFESLRFEPQAPLISTRLSCKLAMIGFIDSLLPWTAATLIPAFVGLFIIVLAGNVLKAKHLAAFSLGIFLWFFVDTIRGAASLDVIDAFSASLVQIGTVGLFVLGLIVFFSFDRNRNVFSPLLANGKYGLAIPLLVAVSVGIHGLGEGAAFGALASQTTSANLLDSFAGPTGGGVNAVVSYVLHKALEPMMIGACYCIYSTEQGKSSAGRLKDLLLLTITFAIPSLVGAASGYYLTYNTTYFYALGTGASIYAAVRLAGPLYDNTQPTSSKESIKMAFLIALGVLVIYFAALFHSG